MHRRRESCRLRKTLTAHPLGAGGPELPQRLVKLGAASPTAPSFSCFARSGARERSAACALGERILEADGLLAIGPDADEAHGDADLFFDELDVTACAFGERIT